jgi:hypothetical protein
VAAPPDPVEAKPTPRVGSHGPRISAWIERDDSILKGPASTISNDAADRARRRLSIEDRCESEEQRSACDQPLQRNHLLASGADT